MRDVYAKYDGLRELIEWYLILDEDTMTPPGEREVCVVLRSQRPSGGNDNLVPNKRASNHLERLDRKVASLLWEDKENSDNIHGASTQTDEERKREQVRERVARCRARKVLQS